MWGTLRQEETGQKRRSCISLPTYQTDYFSYLYVLQAYRSLGSNDLEWSCSDVRLDKLHSQRDWSWWTELHSTDASQIAHTLSHVIFLKKTEQKKKTWPERTRLLSWGGKLLFRWWVTLQCSHRAIAPSLPLRWELSAPLSHAEHLWMRGSGSHPGRALLQKKTPYIQTACIV